jgi:hypothetical protein
MAVIFKKDAGDYMIAAENLRTDENSMARRSDELHAFARNRVAFESGAPGEWTDRRLLPLDTSSSRR